MKTIFDSTHIGALQLKNRLWRSATWMNMADQKGHLTERLENVYLELAKGGVGTIITGYAFVLEAEQPNPGMLGIYDDSFIAEYKKLAGKIRKYGSNIIMQLVYGGSTTTFRTKNRVIWGPSAIRNPRSQTVPTAMTQDNINTVVDAFAKAAGRCKKAGFNGIQLHAAHAYLLSQFLSPFFNKREDRYGGTIENRARIVFEVLDAVRQEVGPEYPVFIKMHCTDEWEDNGLTSEESLHIAQKLELHGITGIEFSGGNPDNENYPNSGPIRAGIIKEENQSYFATPTAKIAGKLQIPVISVGGHRSPEIMEAILNETKIDYFSLSRPLLSEPHLINRWQQGDRNKLRCVACNNCWDKDGNICIQDRRQ